MTWGPGGQIDRLTFAGMRGGGGKGGSKTSTTQQSSQSQTNLPDWLSNAAQQAVQMGQNLSQAPYQPYTGQMVAGVTPDTQQAYQQVRNLQGTANPAFQASGQAWQGLLGSAAPITAGGVNANTNQLFGNYQQQVMNPAQGLLGGFAAQGPATAGQVGANAQALMSPYTQQVLDPAMQLSRQQLAQSMQGIAGQAQNVGAFGGTRQGVEEGVATGQQAIGAGQLAGNLLQQGWNTALTPAQNIALQGGQEAYGASGLLSQLGQQGFQNAQAAGQNIANTNLQAGLTAAQQYPTQAIQQANLAQQQAGAMQAIGTAQQQQQQAELNAQMGQFYQQQQWPYQNLDVLLSAVGGVPYGTSTFGTGTGTTTQRTNPGLMDQITGAIGAGAKIASMFTPAGPAVAGASLVGA